MSAEPLMGDEWSLGEETANPMAVYKDLFMWPAFFLEDLKRKDPVFLDLLAEKFAKGLCMVTDYSGVGSAEIACHFIHAAAERRSIPGVIKKPVFLRASDSNPDCRSVLMNHRGSIKPTCVMGNLLDRVPRTLQDTWQASLSKYQEDMKQLIRQDNSMTAADRKVVAKNLGREFLKEGYVAMTQEGNDVIPEVGWCYLHQKGCSFKSSLKDYSDFFKVSVSGVTCTDFSSMGVKMGFLGESSIPFLAWVRERLHFQEDLLGVECVPDFDHEVFELLLPMYNLYVLSISPNNLGVPATRKRKYMLLLHSETCRWRVQAAGLESFFRNLFFREVNIDANDFCSAPTSFLEKHLSKLALSRGFPTRAPSGAMWKAKQLISTKERETIREWEKKVRVLCGLQEADPTTSFMNVTQSVARSPHAKLCPALITNSRLWAMKEQRFLLLPELFEVQGFAIFDKNIPEVYMCPFRHILLDSSNSMSETSLRRMAGNGMSMPCIGACLCFALGCSLFEGNLVEARSRLFGVWDDGNESSDSTFEEEAHESSEEETAGEQDRKSVEPDRKRLRRQFEAF